MYTVLKSILIQLSVKTLGKSLSTFLCYYTIFSMCIVSTTSLLMKHSLFLKIMPVVDFLNKEIELCGISGSEFDHSCGG